MTWYLGDVTGAILLTPLIVLLIAEYHNWYKWMWLLLIPIAFCSFGIALAIFSPVVMSSLPIMFITLPAIVWAAMVLDRLPAVLISGGVQSIALFGTLLGYGPFSTPYISLNTRLLILQAFLALCLLLTLLISTTMRELRLLHANLEQKVLDRTEIIARQAKEFALAQQQVVRMQQEFIDRFGDR